MSDHAPHKNLKHEQILKDQVDGPHADKKSIYSSERHQQATPAKNNGHTRPLYPLGGGFNINKLDKLYFINFKPL